MACSNECVSPRTTDAQQGTTAQKVSVEERREQRGGPRCRTAHKYAGQKDKSSNPGSATYLFELSLSVLSIR